MILSQIAVFGFIFFKHLLRSNGQFFGTLPDGSNFELNVLMRPNVSAKALLNWATLAATGTYTLNFVSFEDDLRNLKPYFTTEGYENFVDSLQQTGTLSTIQTKKLVVTAAAIGPAIIAQENDVRGYHNWRIVVPITVSYLSASEEEKRNKLVTLLITQVPTSDATTGIGIAQYQSIDLNPDVMS